MILSPTENRFHPLSAISIGVIAIRYAGRLAETSSGNVCTHAAVDIWQYQRIRRTDTAPRMHMFMLWGAIAIVNGRNGRGQSISAYQKYGQNGLCSGHSQDRLVARPLLVNRGEELRQFFSTNPAPRHSLFGCLLSGANFLQLCRCRGTDQSLIQCLFDFADRHNMPT